VTTYQYRCAEHGPHDVALPFGTATPTRACPSCGDAMARVFSAPMLGRGSRAAVAAIDATRATAERPAVVRSVPAAPGRAPTTPRNPAWNRLPQP
jgi:putative FmdB family regulatory protein